MFSPTSTSFPSNEPQPLPTTPDAQRSAMEVYTDQIIEKHMRDLRSDFSGLVSSQTSEYMARITNLEQQLRDNKTINAYLENQTREAQNALRKMQIEMYDRDERLKAMERRVVCIIDGDGCIFALPYLAQGRQGGRLAAQKLYESIRQHLSNEQYQIHVWVFVNKRGLCDALRKCGKKEAADGFDNFMLGFNQAAERFIVVDVGDGKEMVDSKVKAYLEDEIKVPQTLRVIFGGCHDNGYLTTISSLITSGYEQKLVLLPGYAETAAGFRSLNLPQLVIADLFEQEKLTTVPMSAVPMTTVPTTSARARSASAGGSPTLSYTDAVRVPPSPAAVRRSAANTTPKTRHIDPTKPLHKQDPPPCNLFYLTTNCKAGASCVFAHDYILKSEHYEEMKQNAKKSPCAAVNRGDYCPFGDTCCYGHKCPHSTRCYYLKQGTCKFVGAGMHAE